MENEMTLVHGTTTTATNCCITTPYITTYLYDTFISNPTVEKVKNGFIVKQYADIYIASDLEEVNEILRVLFKSK